MSNLINALNYIRTNNMVEIKAGNSDHAFLEIWMVNIDSRIFARSWNLSERSWYSTFLSEKVGELKCGNQIFKVHGIIPPDIKLLNQRINSAYLEKYDFGLNSIYAKGIVQPKHVEKTLEFIIL